jgi:hypothetical protein
MSESRYHKIHHGVIAYFNVIVPDIMAGIIDNICKTRKVSNILDMLFLNLFKSVVFEKKPEIKANKGI